MKRVSCDNSICSSCKFFDAGSLDCIDDYPRCMLGIWGGVFNNKIPTFCSEYMKYTPSKIVASLELGLVISIIVFMIGILGTVFYTITK